MRSRYSIKKLFDLLVVAENVFDYIGENQTLLKSIERAVLLYVLGFCERIIHDYCNGRDMGFYLSDDQKKAAKNVIEKGVGIISGIMNEFSQIKLEEMVRTAGIYVKTRKLLGDFVDNYSMMSCLDDVKKRLKEVLGRLRFGDMEKRYAFYGVGVHTDGLLKMYEDICGDISASIDYYVTSSFEYQTFRNKKVEAIANIGNDYDGIVISSYLHKDFMREKIKKMNIDIPIIDFYDTYDTDLFAWYMDY